MANPLSNHNLARLHAKFVLPMVVDRMLRDIEPLDDVAEYAMNEILYDMCPDTALLCLALCGRSVAGSVHYLPAGRTLSAECDHIVDEYGTLWLAHERGRSGAGFDEDAAIKLLRLVPEDLESLRDALEAVMSELEEDHCVAAILCDIFSLQADHHRVVAEGELRNMALWPEEPEEEADLACESEEERTNNVVSFPAALRARRSLIRNK